MAIEIERKFLIADDGWRTVWQATGARSVAIRQFYLAVREGFSTRIRIIDERQALLTMKARLPVDRRQGNALARGEFEYPIPLEDAHALEASHVGRVIEKRRHLVAHGGLTIEIDVFAGALAPLVVAEVELAGVEDMPALPAFLGREVTHDEAYSNASLALSGR